MRAKKTTSYEVAQAAGVSRSVVSAVINHTPGIGVGEETRKRVLKAIQELNYIVEAQTRGIKTGLSRCIGIYGDLRDPAFRLLLEGVQQACAARDYHVLIGNWREDGGDEGRMALLELYRQRRIDGIVGMDGELDDRAGADSGGAEAWFGSIRQFGVPYVSVEGGADRTDITSFLIEPRFGRQGSHRPIPYAELGREAVEVLFAQFADLAAPAVNRRYPSMREA